MKNIVENNKLIAEFMGFVADKSFEVKFADNNNPYSIGDVFTDHIGSIVIEKISYNLNPYNGGLPCCAFFGKELKKDGTPKKNGSARLAYQANDIKKKF